MYEFLHHLKHASNAEAAIQMHENFFIPVDIAAIKRVEQVWGFALPSQLAEFYKELGWGQIQTGKSSQVSDGNYIASLDELLAIADRTSDWLTPYTKLEPDTLPFFQRDVDFFLCLKPRSDNPNAVWHMWGELMPNGGKISNSLVDFFQRLVEDPNWFNPIKPVSA